MSDSRLRAQSFLNNWFEVVLLAAVVVVVIGGWMTYGAYVAPGTHQSSETVDQWAVNGAFSEHAVVRNAGNQSVFENGQVVDNRTVYFQSVMPVLNGTFTLAYSGLSVPARVRLNETLLFESSSTTQGGKDVYWRKSRRLTSTETTVQRDGQAAVPFSVNVPRALQTVKRINTQLGSPGSTSAIIRVNAVIDPQGDAFNSRRVTFTLPIKGQSGVYRVSNQPQRKQYSHTKTVTVPNDPGPLKAVGGPLFLLAGLAAVAALAAAYWRGALALTDAERAWLGYRDDRSEFEEWITSIRLPAEVDELPVAEAASLGDLVDFAIDTDNAVLESPDGVFQVVHDGYRYRYEAPAAPAEGEQSGGDALGQREEPTDAAADPADE